MCASPATVGWIKPLLSSIRNRRGTATLALAGVLLFVFGCAGEEPWFEEQAQSRGIDFQHRSGFSSMPMLPDIVGGGAALADLDGDGDLDAYLVQSGQLPGRRDAYAPSLGNRLYLNRGDGYFDEAPNTGDGADPGYGMGVAAGDYDNDGDIDVYVANYGPNALLRNDGSGVFENVADEAGVDDPGWGSAAAFLDLDADDDLDLFLVNYLNWSPAIERYCYDRGDPTYCAPTTYAAPAPDRLFRNDGDGTFTDITRQAGLNTTYGNGLGVVGADFDGDGLTDVFVANDRNVNQLWLNQGNLRFEDKAADWGCAVDEHGMAKAGMGVAAGDLDDDGDPDLLVVNFEGETDSFFRNEGAWFVDATALVGLGAGSSRHTRFGVALADFDNDGVLDLYEANGKVDGNPAAVPDAFAEPNVLYRGRSDAGSVRFHELRPSGGVATPLVHTSRGLAVGDVDGDGGLDLLVVNRDGPAYLLMNRAPERGNWVRFRALTKVGGDAHGATVSVIAGTTRLHRDVQPAASYFASNAPHVHFGLGNRARATGVTVRWPGGEVEAFGDFDAGASWRLHRGDGTPLRSP